jgi:hypothetical protein
MSNGSLPPKPGALQAWQRANVVAAINYLGEIIGRSPGEVRARAIYEGLLEVLDPSRRVMRAQREMAEAARTAALSAKNERRQGERRRAERRKASGSPPGGVERRTGRDRRTGQDRRRGRS